MQRTIIVFTLLLSSTWANTLDVMKYHVDLSLFGRVGNVEIILDTKDNEYAITMNAKTTGSAAKLAGKQHVTYISRGKIINKKFIPDTLEKYLESQKKDSYEVYLFDHDEKEVTYFKEQTDKKTSTHFNILTFETDQRITYKHSQKSETLDHYNYYDTLTVLLNIEHLANQEEQSTLEPIGAFKKNQTITIKECDDEGLKKRQKLLHSHQYHKILLLRIKKKGKEYELLLGLDENGMIHDAVTAKSIFLIGDGKIKRSSYQTLKKVSDVDAPSQH